MPSSTIASASARVRADARSANGSLPFRSATIRQNSAGLSPLVFALVAGLSSALPQPPITTAPAIAHAVRKHPPALISLLIGGFGPEG